MIWRCSLFLLIQFTANTSICLSQLCDQFTGLTKDNTGANMFSFKDPIEVFEGKGEKGFFILGFLSESTLVLVFKVVGGRACVRKGDGIHVEFTDGTKLKLKNVYDNNCEQKSVLYFSEKLNTLGQLEMFKTKQIASLKVWTTTPNFVKIDFPEESALRLSESLKCLSTLFDAILPEDTAPVEPEPNNIDPQSVGVDTTKIFMVVEQQPQFEGGYEAMMYFIMRNLNFPESAKKAGIHGTVYVSFVVKRDGSVKEIKILRGIHPDLDAEAIRVVQLMPRWKPGVQNGVPVDVRFNLPIKFK